MPRSCPTSERKGGGSQMPATLTKHPPKIQPVHFRGGTPKGRQEGVPTHPAQAGNKGHFSGDLPSQKCGAGWAAAEALSFLKPRRVPRAVPNSERAKWTGAITMLRLFSQGQMER